MIEKSRKNPKCVEEICGASIIFGKWNTMSVKAEIDSIMRGIERYNPKHLPLFQQYLKEAVCACDVMHTYDQ